jgi:hypothetical protein
MKRYRFCNLASLQSLQSGVIVRTLPGSTQAVFLAAWACHANANTNAYLSVYAAFGGLVTYFCG